MGLVRVLAVYDCFSRPSCPYSSLEACLGLGGLQPSPVPFANKSNLHLMGLLDCLESCQRIRSVAHAAPPHTSTRHVDEGDHKACRL